MLNDKPYGDQALNEFQQLIQQLNETVKKLNAGEGTAGKLIADPSVYESINDVLIGINESKLLRWLIRSRQEKGIEKRYNEDKKTAPAAPEVKTNVAPATTTPPPVVPSTTTSSDTTKTVAATSTQQ